ncbi:Putative endoglucanase [Planctomycetes bacterium MalM25]|nr:Putative endoglucanase [Planctomycetes bacterium MalM25]
MTPALRCLAGLLLAASLLTTASAVERQAHATGRVAPAHQWEPVDLVFTVEAAGDQPFEADFSATFKSDGRTLTVPGFYNGGREYLVRFTPPAAGEWAYTTASSVASLDGLAGELNAEPARDGRRGGIVIDPESSIRLAYENGEAYYPIAFEADWLFALDAENADGAPVAERFIRDLAENGYNQVVLNVFAYDVNWAKDPGLKPEHEFGSPRVFPFGGDNENPDHGVLDVEYFKRFDRVIEALDREGIAAHLMIYVWNKRVAWPEANSAEDNRYFDYVAKRYQAFPNLIWDISKEALGYGHTDVGYITSRIEHLREIDAYQRLITVHDYGYNARRPETVDFISVQLWQSELYHVMRNVREKFPDQPILNIEHGGYERGPYTVFTGAYTSSEVCLERAYQCVFAGTYPSHYWQGAAWNVIVPDWKQLPEDERPRFEYYRHLQKLVEHYDLNALRAGDKMSNSGFCLHNGVDRYVYYVPKENDAMGVNLPKSYHGRELTITWFDPFTGEFQEPERLTMKKWLGVTKPDTGRFSVVIVEVQPEG